MNERVPEKYFKGGARAELAGIAINLDQYLKLQNHQENLELIKEQRHLGVSGEDVSLDDIPWIHHYFAFVQNWLRMRNI